MCIPIPYYSYFMYVWTGLYMVWYILILKLLWINHAVGWVACKVVCGDSYLATVSNFRWIIQHYIKVWGPSQLQSVTVGILQYASFSFFFFFFKKQCFYENCRDAFYIQYPTVFITFLYYNPYFTCFYTCFYVKYLSHKSASVLKMMMRSWHMSVGLNSYSWLPSSIKADVQHTIDDHMQALSVVITWHNLRILYEPYFALYLTIHHQLTLMDPLPLLMISTAAPIYASKQNCWLQILALMAKQSLPGDRQDILPTVALVNGKFDLCWLHQKKRHTKPK